jgi:hypothetical protein
VLSAAEVLVELDRRGRGAGVTSSAAVAAVTKLNQASSTTPASSITAARPAATGRAQVPPAPAVQKTEPGGAGRGRDARSGGWLTVRAELVERDGHRATVRLTPGRIARRLGATYGSQR